MLTILLYPRESKKSMIVVKEAYKEDVLGYGEPLNSVLHTNSPLVPQMMNKIKYCVRTRHKINLRSAYWFRNIKTGEYMVYYTNTNGPWFGTLSQTKEWLQKQEELRLQGEKIDRPNTKWVFERHLFIDLKVILDRQPLQIGLGRLPDWIRNKRGVISLDTFNDNLCLFRCIAVHRGAHKRDNTRRTRELAHSFFQRNCCL